MNYPKLSQWLSGRTGQDVRIDQLGGACPVQAEGFLNGLPFYFRSRGSRWQFCVGNSAQSDPLDAFDGAGFFASEEFCQWPDAGWIGYKETIDFIATGIHRFLSQQKS